MKTLIIYAHPELKGHCATILQEIKKHIAGYEVLNLYKMKFDPLLSPVEYAMKPKVKYKSIQQKIKKARKLIFIYPHWWGGMPAILKGFFDRVFSHGFAFKFIGKIPKPLLKGKEAIVFKTTGGPTFFHLLNGNRDSKIIKNEILGFCGIKTKVIQIGNCVKLTNKKKAEISKIVDDALIDF